LRYAAAALILPRVPREHLFATRAGRVYAETEGSGPAVLIAGGGPGVGHSHYHPWFSALADRFTVVYMDYPGTGRSVGASRASCSIEAYADAIETVRAGLAAEALLLIGVSFGGLPAIEKRCVTPSACAGSS
jgi:3-oxoadipate enol-lactonase